MDKQQLRNQKGEIDFRKKLYMQQVKGNKIFDDEYDVTGIETILEDRMKKTFNQMSSLKEKNIALSPYLEIGAERCQRSLVMENDLGLNGAALDISFDMLKSCDHYQDVFNKVKSPVKICCDAYNLPFQTDSIPFVFCYETLHHFPEPAPITKEIYRVLMPGGFFYFDEEPYKQILHVNLIKGQKMYSENSLGRSRIKRTLDYFLSERSCNEVEHGIIENFDITLRSWKNALMHFEEKNVKLEAFSSIQSDLFNPRSYMKYLAAYLFGGKISGVCRKLGNNDKNNNSIYDVLICPSCRETGSEILLNRNNSLFLCPKCSKKFPVIDKVVFLFTYEKFANLYPEIFNSFSKE